MSDYPERAECDFANYPVRLTQCSVCAQVVPLSLSYKGRYMSEDEHFCSQDCQDEHEKVFEPLPLLREAGL